MPPACAAGGCGAGVRPILARRIADTLAAWIGRETVTEKGVSRPMRPGDVIVLVRKRDAFVNALTRALKQPHNIPVGGADRLVLTGHIAVQDLMALGRFALLPEDDLSLAALLKSPLLGLSEEVLMALAALTRTSPLPTPDQLAALPNVCRCGATPRILKAIQAAAGANAAVGASPPATPKAEQTGSSKFSNGSSGQGQISDQRSDENRVE